MARRLIAGLAPGIELQGDYVVRLVAIDPSTGAAVAGVVVCEVTIQTLGADIVRDAQLNYYQAAPSGVVFSLLFAPWPSSIWTVDVIADQANLWSERWNTNAGQPGVAGINVTREVNDAGNYEDVAFVTVRSTSGKSSGVTIAHVAQFWPDAFAPLVAEERANLDAIEAASP